FVAGEIPSTAKNNVDKVGHWLVYAREHGRVAWEDIVDESRIVEQPATWDNLPAFAAAVERSYRKDFWSTQAYCVQVWREKATVGGILRPVTDEYGTAFLAVHGFGSATTLHDIAIASAEDRRRLIILYVGDYDPSGMFMSEEDLPARL